MITQKEAVQQSIDWFHEQQWTVFDFQQAAWEAWHQGESGLIHSPTGSGKTLAAWLGPLQHTLMEDQETDRLKVLWITPLRALATDTRNHLQAAADALNAPVHVEIRTGDTSSSRRSKQRKTPPHTLVTTPESLSVMLSYPGSDIGLSGVHTIIVDEWHELLGSKRGVQLQLCLARLKALCTHIRIWGVSATLANLEEAMEVLLGPGNNGRLIKGIVPRAVEVDSVLPDDTERFRWSGHLGLQLLPPVIDALQTSATSLLFTNTLLAC